MTKRQVRLSITGLVQGVYYRITMQKTAAMLGVSGWVRNVEDGSVEAIIEGEGEAVRRVIEWCAKGPDEARVDSVKEDEGKPTGEFSTFDVRD